jgi:hypothetical protein
MTVVTVAITTVVAEVAGVVMHVRIVRTPTNV